MREWLKAKRIYHGYTHKDVAMTVHVSRQHYSFIESGQRNPSVQLAKKIAKALDFEWELFYKE